MIIRLTDEQIYALAELAYLGNYVVNSLRDPSKEIKKYSDLADSLYCMIYNCRNKNAGMAEDNEIADVRDRVGAGAEEYLGAFEKDILKNGSPCE